MNVQIHYVNDKNELKIFETENAKRIAVIKGDRTHYLEE